MTETATRAGTQTASQTATQTGSRDGTRSRIVDVASRLLREDGPSAVTTRRVAEEAEVQAPTIYRLFGDKDGLLEAVAEQVMATYVSTKAAAVEAASAADVDPLDDLRAGWDTQVDFGLGNPTLFVFLSDPDRGLRSPAVASGQRVLRARVHRVALAGRLRVGEERAVDLIHAAGTGTVSTLLATSPEHRDPGLAASMLEAVLGQILTDAPADPRHAVPGVAAARRDDALAPVVAVRAHTAGLDELTGAERRLLAEWLDRVIVSREGTLTGT